MGKTNACQLRTGISWPNFLYFLKLTFERERKQKGGEKNASWAAKDFSEKAKEKAMTQQEQGDLPSKGQ